jgi:hypothetical protein
MYRKLAVLSVCAASVASAEPTWTRQLTNADGSTSYVARDGAKPVWIARTAPECGFGTGSPLFADASDYAFTSGSDALCYQLPSGVLELWRIGAAPDMAAAVRTLARIIASDTTDMQRLPGLWEHSRDDVARLVDGTGHVFLEDAATAPACSEPCTRGGEPVHRYTRGTLVLDVPVASDTQPSPQAIVTWFEALPDGSSLSRALTAPAPPPAPTPDVTAAPTTAPSLPEDSGRYHEHRDFNAASMFPKHYEILVNQNWLQPPVDLVFQAYDASDKVAFVPVQAIGVTIIEHGGGIIGMINAAFLAGAGGYVGSNADHSVDYYNTNMTSGPGPQASWSFNMSDQYMGFRADSWWTNWIGWRFGLWALRELNNDTTQAMPGPTQDLLTRYNAIYLNNTGGLEIEILMRKVLVMAPLGRIAAGIDLPISYVVGEPLVAAGALDKGDRGMLFTWGGVPRISADFDRRLGPLMIHAVASIPTMYLVVPLNRGAQLTLSAGLTF